MLYVERLLHIKEQEKEELMDAYRGLSETNSTLESRASAVSQVQNMGIFPRFPR